jgi:hypothetical protein
MPELTLPELKQQLRNEKRKTELAQLDLQRMRPEDQRRRFEGSLLEFTKESWRWVEPSPFCTNWHIECMCEHFEAVSHRQILRLLINVPPRHSKSLGLNVFFPAWVWANNPNVDGQHRQILRLLINVPPRHSKSLGLNVFFPAWVWANNPDVDGAHPKQCDPQGLLAGAGGAVKDARGHGSNKRGGGALPQFGSNDPQSARNLPHYRYTPGVFVPRGGSSLRMVSRIGGRQSWVFW